MEEKISISKKIIESFSSGRCPLCALLRQDEFDFLCKWVVQTDDKYREPSLWERLSASGGFCNYHFWGFEGVNTHYGSATAAAEVLGKAIKILRDAMGGYSNKALKKQDYVGNIKCPVCSDLVRKEAVYLRELVTILKEPLYRTKYSESWGLCIPHFFKILDYIEDDLLIKYLFGTEIEQAERVKTNAMNFVSKKGSSKRWEQTDDEQKSYFRAIEKLIGRRGA